MHSSCTCSKHWFKEYVGYGMVWILRIEANMDKLPLREEERGEEGKNFEKIIFYELFLYFCNPTMLIII